MKEKRPPTSLVVSCFACGASYSPDRWSELPRVDTLTGSELRQYLLRWPNGSVVEVRSCSVCDKPMARRRSVG
jgi:hypothetical protein